MRLSRHLRFSIRTLMLVTALFAIAIWWVRWPTLTASRFAKEPQSFRMQDPNSSSGFETFSEFVARGSDTALTPHSRSVRDYLVGQQSFDCGPYEFTVARGRIMHGPNNNGSLTTSCFDSPAPRPNL